MKKGRKKTKSTAAWPISPPGELAPEPPEPPLPEDASPPAIDAAQNLLEDDRPDTSPYTSATAALRFGTEGIQYNIPIALLPSSIAPNCGYPRTIYLSKIDPDIAHPLVHFLHTGRYETLRSGEETLVARTTREHQRALSLYVAASKYGLHDLQTLAMEKVFSTKLGVPTGDILQHLEAALPDASDEDEFLASCLTDTLKRTFSELANPLDKAPYEQLSSRFARAMVNSVAVIFADMQASASEKAKASHIEESYHMPAPPEEPAVEADCLSPSGMAKCERLTHDSFSVVSCDDGIEAAGSDHKKDDLDAFSANTAYDGLELESYKEDVQPPEGADAGELPEPDAEEKIFDECSAVPAEERAGEKYWSGFLTSKKKKKKRSAVEEEPLEPLPAAVEWPAVVVKPEITEDEAVPPSPQPEPPEEELPAAVPECYDDGWAFTALSKKKKKEGRNVIPEPVTDECRHRAEHLLGGWESCNTCRGFVLSVVQEKHRKMSEARYR